MNGNWEWGAHLEVQKTYELHFDALAWEGHTGEATMNSVLGTNTEWDNPRQVWETTVLRKVTYRVSVLSLILWKLDLKVVDMHNVHPGNAWMLGDNWQSIIWLWLYTQKYTYRWPCHTMYNPNYYSRDQIKCRMAEITMPNTMPITMLLTMPNTMLNLLWSHHTDNTILNKITTQTWWSRGIRLQWQLMTINGLRNQPPIKPFQWIFYKKKYDIGCRWSNDFLQEGVDCTGVATPTANNYRTRSARTKHRETHSIIENASSSMCTWWWID